MTELTKDIEQVLLGSLLGDGCLCLTKKNKVVYKETHSKKQEQYLDYKRNILNKFFVVGKGNYEKVMIWTSDKRLTYYYNLFYLNHKKIITQEILGKLKPSAIAIWHCDDGNLSRKGVMLATHCFGYEGNLLIQRWFKEKYSIEFKMRKVKDFYENGKNYYLMANKEDSLRFIDLIKDYVPECMDYKIDMENENRKYRKYYLRNRERSIQKYKDYYYNGNGKIKSGEYYSKNREKILEAGRLYREKNRDLINKKRRDIYKYKKEQKIYGKFSSIFQ